jgi:enoyl-CoA hydratase
VVVYQPDNTSGLRKILCKEESVGYKYIIYEKEGEIARIIMNKPEKLNSYTFISVGEDFAEMLDAFKQAENDDEIKVVILKGAGRCFSAGQNLARVGFVYGFGTGKGERRPSQRIRLKMDKDGIAEGFRTIFLCRKLTIAQVHGYALEAGLMIAMLCDFTIVADDAMVGFPGQRIGFAGGGEHTFGHLAMAVGVKRALDLYITGRQISGKEAAEIGLATRSVPPDRLEEEVNTLAKQLCLLPRDGIAIGKATRHLFYDRLGFNDAFTYGYITHTLFTNLHHEAGEFNFFRERREKGAREAFHEKDDRFSV